MHATLINRIGSLLRKFPFWLQQLFQIKREFGGALVLTQLLAFVAGLVVWYRVWRMSEIGKILVGVGLVLAAVGALLWAAGNLNLPLGRLPGDLRIDRPNFKFYFPLTTCLLISVVLTLLLWLLRRR